MNKKLEKTLLEMFGEPLDSTHDAGVYAKNPSEIIDVGMIDVKDTLTVCPTCGELPIDGICGCDAVEVCPMCGQMPQQIATTCSCGLENKLRGVNELTKQCKQNVDEVELDEVAPEGYENIVKALKKDPDVDNPWAVAWSMKKKGIKPRD